MAAAWRVLDLTGFEGEIWSRKGHLIAHYPDGTEKTAALADTAVILVGMKCGIRAAVFAAAGNYGVPVLFCDWKGIPLAGSWPWSTHSTAGGRQRGQVEQSLPGKKQAWKKLVQAKIRGQARVLESVGDVTGCRHLRDLAAGVRSGDPDNVEAAASRMYWRRIFQDLDFRRERGADDISNAILNYGYTVLRGVVLREVVSSGLWPAAGVHHSNMRNAFPLVDDLIEPFRPAMDRLAWEIVQDPDTTFDVADRRTVVGILDREFDGRTGRSVSTAIRDLCREYGMHVGEGSEFSPRHWTGEVHGGEPGEETG